MEAPTAQWDELEQALLASVPADYPFDPEIVPLVVALNLLGFPTIGSCSGHPWDGVDEEGPWLPYVAMRWRLPRRIQRNWLESGWASMFSGDPRERQALALLGWAVYRPAAWRLRGLLDEFYAGSSDDRLIQVEATSHHVGFYAARAVWELELAEQNDAVAAAGRQFAGLGEWLRQRLLDQSCS